MGSGQAVGLVSLAAADAAEHTADPPQSGVSQPLLLKADVSPALIQEQSQGSQVVQCPSAIDKSK